MPRLLYAEIKHTVNVQGSEMHVHRQSADFFKPESNEVA